MGYNDTFDEYIYEARDNIERARELLLKCLDTDTWGNSDRSTEYKDTVNEVAFELYKLQNKL